MSWTLKWRDEEYLDRPGTMNSDARRKPKYHRNELPRTSDDLEGRDPKTHGGRSTLTALDVMNIPLQAETIYKHIRAPLIYVESSNA